jgi:uncharacterized membrane protein (UPF0127 family)
VSFPRKSFLTCQNLTRQTLLGDRIAKADTYLRRLVGLLPQSSLQPGEGLWIVPCREIHSVGMRLVFDALFLDRSLQVVHLMPMVKPWRVSPLIRAAHSVLELPAETIADTQTQIGDILVFQ